jgi:hypothetical protein
MGGGWSSTRGKVLSGARAGVLARWVTPELIDEVLAAAGREQRRFRALPARLAVYFVLGLCLYSSLPYADVVRDLAGGLARALRAAGWRVPSSTALTGARRRLGEKPFELLFWRLCSVLSPGRAPWSHICGLLAVAWDGTTVKAPASSANIAAFGKPGRKARGTGGQKAGTGGKKKAATEGAYPQLRLVSLVACGTRALAGAAFGPYTQGERALAAQLLGCLRGGMLLLADAGFYSYQLWKDAAATGAQLLWRMQDGIPLPVLCPLPDGSWLSELNDPAETRRRAVRNWKRRASGGKLPPDTGPLPGRITVRVIAFTLTVTKDDGTVSTEDYRLITTLLDHRAAPAKALAGGYAWRWAIETGYREFKACLRGAGRILRGRTPELARQELWAYLIIYQAIRAVIALAAAGARLDPDRISFTTTLHAIRRTLTAARTSPDAALAETEADITATLVPERHGRVCPRAVNQPVSRYPSKKNRKEPVSQHASYTVTTTRPDQAPRTPASQPEHPASQHDQPP